MKYGAEYRAKGYEHFPPSLVENDPDWRCGVLDKNIVNVEQPNMRYEELAGQNGEIYKAADYVVPFFNWWTRDYFQVQICVA